MAEYHPDKVAHLGLELRALAAKKAVQFNLAMQLDRQILKVFAIQPEQIKRVENYWWPFLPHVETLQ